MSVEKRIDGWRLKRLLHNRAWIGMLVISTLDGNAFVPRAPAVWMDGAQHCWAKQELRRVLRHG